MEYIKKILGHTDIKTTSEAYLNVQDADVSAAHRRFSPLSNLQRADAGKGLVLPDGGKSGDQPALPRTHTKQQAHEETSSEQMPLRNSKQESLPKLAHDRSTAEHQKTEATERPDDADARLRPICWERYNEHLRKLANLTGELIADIENGNLEPLVVNQRYGTLFEPNTAVGSALSCHEGHRRASRRRVLCGTGGSCSIRRSRR